MPIYLVKAPSGDKLVDAGTKAGAINHVVHSTVTAEAVTASELVGLMQDNGMKVEKAKQEPKEKAND